MYKCKALPISVLHFLISKKPSLPATLVPIPRRNCTGSGVSGRLGLYQKMIESQKKSSAMKKHQSFLYGIALASCFAVFTSCQKEEQPVIDPVEETATPVDSIHDLAGYFNSGLEVFFIDPVYMDQIMEFMGVFPTTDGGFGLTEQLEDGLWIDYFFHIMPMPIPEIYFVSTDLETQDTGEEKGVRYKIYKKAECGEKVAKKAGDCQNLPEIDPDTEAASFKSSVAKEYKRCKASKTEGNLCKDRLLPVGKTVYYNELNCSGKVVDEKDYLRYRCD